MVVGLSVSLSAQICRTTGAVLSTRGRYMNSVEKMNVSSGSGDRPLYIHIQAPRIDAIERAMCRINAVMREYTQDGSESTFGTQQPAEELSAVTTFADLCVTANAISLMSVAATGHQHHYVQDKIFVGLEHAPANYPFLEKILGPGGSYLDHIHVTTGATVTLRGKGSGFIEPTSGREAFEPLHIHITHPNLEGLQAAKTLAISLIQTTHQDLAEWQQQQLASVALQSAVAIQAPLASQTQMIAGLGQAVFQPVVSGGEMQTQGILVGNGAGGASIVVPVSLTSSVPTSVSYVTALPQAQATVMYPTSQVLAHAVVPQHSMAAPTMVPPPMAVAPAGTPTMVPPPSVAVGVPQSYANFITPSVPQPTYVSASVTQPLLSVSMAPPTFVSTSVAPPTLVSMSVPPPTFSTASMAPPMVAPPPTLPHPSIPPPTVPPPTLQQPQQVVATSQPYQVMHPPPAYVAPTVYPHLRHQYAQYAVAKQGYDVPTLSAVAAQQQQVQQQEQQQAQEQQQVAATTTTVVATTLTTASVAYLNNTNNIGASSNTTGSDDWRFRVPPPPLPDTSVPPPSIAPPPATASPPPQAQSSPAPPPTTTANSSTSSILYYRSTLPRSKSSFLSTYCAPPLTTSASTPSATSGSATSLFRVPPPPLRNRVVSSKSDWDLMPPPRAPLSSGGAQRNPGVAGTASSGQAYSCAKRPSDATNDSDWKRIRGTP